MNKEALVPEVFGDERKAFVRAHVHRAMHRLQRPRRSKDPIQAKVRETICDLLTNTDQGRLRIVAEANFQWQKLQLRKFLRTRGIYSYKDMKDFIHAHGWDELWIPTRRLPGYCEASAGRAENKLHAQCAGKKTADGYGLWTRRTGLLDWNKDSGGP